MIHNNAQIFNDTEHQYKTIYSGATKDLINNHTYVYIKHIEDIAYGINPYMTISVIDDGTVNTGRNLKEQYKSKTAILNFANAIVPGGLVLIGANAQEENICRCSNLYASLTSTKAKIYYDINNASVDGVYTDSLIYSEEVLFFKDDTSYEDVEPYRLDVITCPAPSIQWSSDDTEYNTIYCRVEQIIKSAILHGVKNIVLGAWGCGAFGQNPNVVAKCFKDALKSYKAFDNVVFAIKGCKFECETNPTSNYSVFKRILLSDCV